MLASLLVQTVLVTVPLILVAAGIIACDSVGVSNVGQNGLVAAGAAAGWIVGSLSGSPWLGVLAGAVAGALVNMLFALFTIRLHVNHLIVGIVLNIAIPPIADAVVGAALDTTSATCSSSTALVATMAVLACVCIVTAPQLLTSRGRTSGTSGTSNAQLNRTRYLACALNGALAGLAGALLTICVEGGYTDNVVGGRGLSALFAAGVGSLRVGETFVMCIALGFAEAIVTTFGLEGALASLVGSLPWIVAIVALVAEGCLKKGRFEQAKPARANN